MNGLPGNWQVTYTLSVTKTQNAHGDVTLWNTQTKQTQITIPYSQNWTAGASPILYMEGVAEGYAEREIALTLQAVPSGAPAPSTDIVNVTVTPVLQTLTVTRTSGDGPPPWQATPGLIKVQNNYVLISNFGTPEGTPAANMSATALNTNLGGQLSFIQNAAIVNNLKDSKNNAIGVTMGTTNKAGAYAPPNNPNGTPLIDCAVATDIPYYIGRMTHNVTTANGVQTVTDQDTPKIPANDVMPVFLVGVPQVATQLDVSQSFTFYAVWQYPDQTYWPLARTGWNVHYAGQITTGAAPVFKPNANNAVNSSAATVWSNDLPKAKGAPIANDGNASWVVVPGG